MSPIILLFIALVAINLTYILAMINILLFIIGTSSISTAIPLSVIICVLFEFYLDYLFDKYNIDKVEDLL